jgi:acyl-ACP thioesterase
MTVSEPEELVPLPISGRIFPAQRRVRLGDATSRGRVRLDAIARYLQDIANDDSRDAGSPNPTAWVARRTLIRVERFPTYLEMLAMCTWCSGMGPRWAERRYSLHGEVDGKADRAGLIEAATLWVHIDMQTMKPIAVPADFADQFAQACGGRRISARLHLPTTPPSPTLAPTVPRAELWPLRAADVDVLGHVNNAVYWAMVEQELFVRGHLEQPLTVTLEHHAAIEPGASVTVTAWTTETGFDMWVTTADDLLAAVIRAVTHL